MNRIEDLNKFMTWNKGERMPLFVSKVNGNYIIAVYQGSLSEFDLLIKYRQLENEKWSRIRTPKHIHWAVDMLIKIHEEPEKTKDFLNFLLKVWNDTKPIRSEEERSKILNIQYLLETYNEEIQHYEDLGDKGEYSIKFLILLARLLMLQEKTNREDAYMFKKALIELRSDKNIFGIVSIATHNKK